MKNIKVEKITKDWELVQKFAIREDNLERVEKQIQASIRSETGLRVDVTICEPESLPRSEGKAVRVIDERDFER